jgi:hypothetical protein
MKSHFLKISMSVAALTFIPSAASAQFAAMNAIRIDVNMGGATKQFLKDARESDDNTAVSQPRVPFVKLNYKPSLTAQKRNLANFVAKTRAVDPAAAAELERLFTSDLMRQIDTGMRGLGLSSSNVADAYALYWTSAWLGARGRDDNLPSKQMIAVRDQAARALLSTSVFSTASDQQKQELTDALLVQSALIAGYVNGGKQDAALMPKVKAAIAQGAKSMGLDLYAMTLTEDGFVPAKKGSAIDEGISTVPGREEQALASNTPAENAPNYALIAAAGGAGLGGMFLLGKVMERKN